MKRRALRLLPQKNTDPRRQVGHQLSQTLVKLGLVKLGLVRHTDLNRPQRFQNLVYSRIQASLNSMHYK